MRSRVVSWTSWRPTTHRTPPRRRSFPWRMLRPDTWGTRRPSRRSTRSWYRKISSRSRGWSGRWVESRAYGISLRAPADLALVDLSEEWMVRADALVSRSSNSPYLGRRLKGRVVGTVVGGELVYDRTGAKFGARA